MDQMDIRIDTGFHHRNPNVHILLGCIENPGNAFDPKYIPITIFNLSHIGHLYIGRDTVLLLQMSQQWTCTMWNLPVKTKSRSTWVPQCHETLPEIPSNTTFICSLADVPGHRDLKSCVKSMARHFQNTMRTLAEPSLSRWT